MTDDDKENTSPKTPETNPSNPYQNPPWLRRPTNGAGGKSLGVKFFLLGILALTLCIPLFMVWGLVKEREANYRSATAEIGRQWGADQTINGPFLAVPVVQQWTERKDDKNVLRRQMREVLIAPDKLDLSADAETMKRERGIHEAIVYKTKMDMTAAFSRPDLGSLSNQIVSVDWSRAKLVLSVSDTKGIVDINIVRDGNETAEVEPGLGLGTQMSDHYARSGLHVPLKLDDQFGSSLLPASTSSDSLQFDISMAFKGSQTLSFVPVGESTKVALASSWPHPSFSGAFLPTERQISEDGFEAQWMVSKLARSIPQLSLVDNNSFGHYNASGFGVRFYQPVDFYRLVDRAVKYGVLFIGTAFLIIFAV
ncbi:MAG: cell envelope integrity protein CreD, partial [Pseudomonadota bacterium]